MKKKRLKITLHRVKCIKNNKFKKFNKKNSENIDLKLILKVNLLVLLLFGFKKVIKKELNKRNQDNLNKNNQKLKLLKEHLIY